MKIIGFLQVRNELSTGHLLRFLEVNKELFDALYVFDDNSDDGTYEYINVNADHVIRGESRMFGSELVNKSDLLEKVKLDFATGDAVLWLDADEVLYATREELEEAINLAFDEGFDGLSLPHINLWRSNNWLRLDDNYDSLEAVRIWKLSEKLSFPRKSGLHGQMYPNGITRIKRVNSLSVVHFGFASIDYVLDKFVTYKSHWQSGYALHRLISEYDLQLEPLASRIESLGSRYTKLHVYPDLSRPVAFPQYEWIQLADSKYEEYLSQKKPRVTLVSLIYASTKWLEFTYSQLLELKRDLPDGEAEILFVANDANEEVLSFLKDNSIPHISVSTKIDQNEWFINSVYRAYNLGVINSQTEYVYLVNSDMAYARGALSNVMKAASPNRLVASRLVELGIMPSGKHGIEKDFGASPKRYRRNDFERFAKSISTDELLPGGLFMPLLVHRENFMQLGGYPEGNLTESSLEEYLEGGLGEIAQEGDRLIPGDAAFIARAKKIQIEHLTLMSSIAYHFQAGERRDENSPKSIRSGVVVLNDSLVGINGEVVLWGKLISLLEKSGTLVRGIATGIPKGRLAVFLAPIVQSIKGQIMIRRNRGPRLLITNATYQVPIVGPWRKILVNQDKPAGSWLLFLQRISLLNADRYVANDAELVASNRGRKSEWATIPLSTIWWEDPKVTNLDKKKVIFIGAFNETKGWSVLKKIIEAETSIDWILVSKYSEKPDLSESAMQRVEAYSQLNPIELRDLLRTASALVVASPYETQCLVALEAASQGIPVVTTPTGTLGSFGIGTKEFGIVTEDLSEGLLSVLNQKHDFNPRETVRKLDLISESGWTRWEKLIARELEGSFRESTEPSYLFKFFARLKSYAIGAFRRAVRSSVIPFLMNVKRRLS